LEVFPHFHGKLYEMQRTKHDEQIIAIEKSLSFFIGMKKKKDCLQFFNFIEIILDFFFTGKKFETFPAKIRSLFFQTKES
jgi:hypothetical protein